MKILIYSQYLPDPVDGASTSGRALVKYLRKFGVSVQVITVDSDSRIALEAQKESGTLRFQGLANIKLEFSPSAYLSIWRNLRESDICHFRGFFSLGTIFGGWMAWIQGKPLFLSPLGNQLPKWIDRSTVSSGIAKFIFNYILLRPVLKRASLVICASAKEAEGVSNFYKQVPTSVVSNGISFEDYYKPTDRNAIEQLFPHISGQPIVLFIGRISSEKNIEFLLQTWAFRQHTNSRGILVIAGEESGGDTYTRSLKLIAQELNIVSSVLFIGNIKGEIKRAFLQHSSCLVLPSHRESFGNVVLEALASGLPVVVSNNTPWEVLSTLQLGDWLVLDQDLWRTAIDRYCNWNQVERDIFTDRSQMWVKSNYDWNIVVQKYLDLYNQCLQNN